MPRGTSASLIVRKLNTSRRILCAAPEYLNAAAYRKTGGPRSHDCLSYSYLAEPDEWHLIGRRRRTCRESQRPDRHQPPAGVAHCRRPRARHRLRPDRIFPRRSRRRDAWCACCRAIELPEATIYAVYPASRQLSAKVQSLQRFHGALFRSQSDHALNPSMAAQPGDDLGGVLVGREDRIERLHDDAVVDDERHAFHSVMPEVVKVGRCKRARKFQIRIGQDRKRQVQPLGGLALIVGILRRQAEDVSNAERLQFGKMVAKTARLRRAAARARNFVPSRRQYRRRARRCADKCRERCGRRASTD